MQARTQSILFITLSCVGDAIMSTPVLSSLHQHFPNAVIDIVGDKRSSLLFKYCPFAGAIINKDKSRPGRGAFDLLRRLRQTNYDVIVDIRTDGLAYLLRGKRRYTKLGSKPYGPHAVERMMGVIRSLHGDDPIPPACVWTSDEEDSRAHSWLNSLPGDRWLSLAPGAGDRIEKTWPPERYADLANSTADVFTGVIILGTEGDREIAAAIDQKLKLPCVDLTGRTSLLHVAAILKRASFFVGSDSGLGHVAGAVDTPTLTFFSVDRPERVLPWGNRAVWLLGNDNDARNISVSDAVSRIRSCLSGSAEQIRK